MPDGVTYVAGSSQIANSTTDGKYKSTVDGITTTGYNAGSYQPKGNVYFKFSAIVTSNDKLSNCGDNSLVNTAKASTSGGAKEDTATVIVTKTCSTTTPTDPAITTTTELPTTGAGDVAAIVGASALVTSLGYYIASRRLSFKK